MLNRGTEKKEPNRALGERNRSVTSPARVPPPSDPGKLISLDIKELIKSIDEEEANRLNSMDGYSAIPPRPREGFGLQLRPQHDDINEYFTGPKWLDRRTRRFVETAESRPVTPLGPYIDRKPKPKVLFREEGEWVRRPEPPPKLPPRPPPVYTAKNIRFEGYGKLDSWLNRPMKFADPDFLPEIGKVATILRDNPTLHVKVRASVGRDPGDPSKPDPAFVREVMEKRGKAVGNALETMGIDRRRVHIEQGDIGTGDPYRKVDFIFVPAP
jgi:hypothetical protein